MFSTKSLSTKLTLSYGLLHFIITALIISMTYFLITSSLTKKDHKLLESEIKEYEYQYKTKGVEGIREELESNLEGYQDIDLYVALYDKNARILDSNFNTGEIGNRKKDFLRKHLNYNGVLNIISVNDLDYNFDIISLSLDHNAIIQLAIETTNRQNLISNIRMILAAMFLISLMLGLSIGHAVSRRNLRPIQDLIRTIQDIQEGNIRSRVNINPNKDELAQLGSYFNNMIDRVEKTVNSMKSAIDSIAHDLRTPLTRQKILLELALRNKEDHYKLEQHCESALEVTNELELLLKTFLDISEAESGILSLNKVPLLLGELVQEVIELYEFVIEETGVLVTNQVEEVSITGDRQRLKQAIANVLDNAIKYSRPNGEIIFCANIGVSHKSLLIIDDGIGIRAENLEKVWERFYREDESRNLPGLGLGLNLVKSIIVAHDGEVLARIDEQGRTVFELRFRNS